MNFFKKLIGWVSSIFSLVLLVYIGYGFSKKIMSIESIRIVLLFLTVLLGVLSILSTRNLYFKIRILNYLVPYIILLGISYLVINGINNLYIFKYLPVIDILVGYSVIYLIYSLVMLIFTRRGDNKIHF